ncbi:MAG: alpha/beta hydrolase [Deltaproteobacteria bacterium]|nr:alpha/beta hydrolase [Deltaproteobacteria bacterium]
MPTEYFELDHGRMAFEQAGEGDPALVFLHAFACDRTFLAPQMEHFAARHRVVSVDFLGHGESDTPEIEYRLPRFAEDVARLIEHLGLKEVVVVGHSMGGGVALELAAGWPDLVRAAVSIDSTLIPSIERKEKTLPAILRALQGPHYLMAARRFGGSMVLPSDGEAIKEHVEAVMSSPPRHVLVEMIKGLLAWDGPQALARLTRPLLYIGSRRPLTGQAAMLAASPWVQYAQAAGSGHFLTLIVPEQINAMIQHWLEALPFAEAES